MCKFDRDCVSEGGSKLLVASITGGYLGHLKNQSVGAVCVGLVIHGPRTVPNVSSYRPDYLF